MTHVTDALKQIRKGTISILVDREDRENEGDFFLPAELATPEAVNFMITHGKGLVCVAITKQWAEALNLPNMVPKEHNTEKTGVNFSISVNAAKSNGSGISAYDRAATIRLLADPAAMAQDFTRPGHVFPLIAAEGGLTQRDGHTEAAVALAQRAGFAPAGVLCEIVGADGHMATHTELLALSKQFNLPIISIKDLVSDQKTHKQTTLTHVFKTASATLPTAYGTFQISIYAATDGKEHTVLSMEPLTKPPILVRLHSQCLTGDTLLSLRCDCRDQLHESMKEIAKKGQGVILYLNQEGRGIGLSKKIEAYALQETGMDTVEANHALGLPVDARSYDVAAAILQNMGITSIDLLTNNPDKERQLKKRNVRVRTRIPLETPPTSVNKTYLATKKHKLGHRLERV